MELANASAFCAHGVAEPATSCSRETGSVGAIGCWERVTERLFTGKR